MVMGHFPKEILDKQLNFAICTCKKSQDSFPSMTNMAKHCSYHCTFHNLSLHVLSLSLHTKLGMLHTMVTAFVHSIIVFHNEGQTSQLSHFTGTREFTRNYFTSITLFAMY